MTISVLITTYNGEKYIIDLLKTIKKQTLQPTEVLIFDDCSVDNTVSKINEYIKENKLHNWKVVVNQCNKGWKRNFIEGLKDTSGDLIYLCDQDDLWDEDKIEKMSLEMEKNKEILLLASNYRPLYQGKDKHSSGVSKNWVSEFKEDCTVTKMRFGKDFMTIKRPGCVYCVRKNLLSIALPIWFEEWAHDALLWRVALLLDGLYIYNRSTISFRRHDNNASKVIKDEKWLKYVDNYQLKSIPLLKSLLRAKNVIDKEYKEQELDNCQKWLICREKFIQSKSILSWIRMGKYISYYEAPKSYIRDLLIIRFGRTI